MFWISISLKQDLTLTDSSSSAGFLHTRFPNERYLSDNVTLLYNDGVRLCHTRTKSLILYFCSVSHPSCLPIIFCSSSPSVSKWFPSHLPTSLLSFLLPNSLFSSSIISSLSQVNKQQLQAVKERFLAFLNGETQIVADEAFCNAVRSYYEARRFELL